MAAAIEQEPAVGHANGVGQVGRVDRRRERRAFIIVAALALVSHVFAWAMGVSISPRIFGPKGLDKNVWHLLPLTLLDHHPVQSILNLDSQPPLFNLSTAVLVHLPFRLFWAQTAMIAFSTILAIATFGLLRRLGVHRTVSLAVVIVFVVLDPAQLLYPSIYFYALPTAAAITCAAWACACWVQSKRLLPGALFGWLLAIVVLTNSSYQIYGLLVAAIPVVYALRRHWRTVAAALLPPLLVVGAWYANDAARFGMYTTSSWDGMNLARITTAQDSPQDLQLLVRQGALTPLALKEPFGAVEAYGNLGKAKPTGVPALDLYSKASGTPNYNNIAYIAISKAYLSNDLRWIQHRPLDYAKHIALGVRIWLLPSDQTDVLIGPARPLGGWTSIYDHVVMLQWQQDPAAGLVISSHAATPAVISISWTLVVENLLALILLPVVAWRRRRRNVARVAAAAWIWAIVALITVTTSLVEVGENNRFRFEMGALPIVAAVVAVCWLIDDLRPRANKILIPAGKGLLGSTESGSWSGGSSMAPTMGEDP